jgi:hypothetical protein
LYALPVSGIPRAGRAAALAILAARLPRLADLAIGIHFAACVVVAREPFTRGSAALLALRIALPRGLAALAVAFALLTALRATAALLLRARTLLAALVLLTLLATLLLATLLPLLAALALLLASALLIARTAAAWLLRLAIAALSIVLSAHVPVPLLLPRVAADTYRPR